MADVAFSLDLAYAAGAALVGGVLARLLKQSVLILACQGVAEGVVSDAVFSLMLAATVATIALAPLLCRLAPALERGL